MASKLKYDLDSLEWDDKHKHNKEGTYCYCGMDYSEGDSMLRCGECQQLFHWDCVSCLKTKPLKGDCFYKFTCKICNGSEDESYARDTVSWVQVIYLVLYHLINTEPDKKYFRWRENICATINEHWDGLFPGKAKTVTWHNTVAGCLSTHSALFKSGFEDTQQTGNWTLHQTVEPEDAPFRGPTKARGDSDKSVAKRARSRKKDNSAATAALMGNVSDADKEILEVLNESKAAGSRRRKAARQHVSFSDDEDDDEDEGGDSSKDASAGRRGRSKRRRVETKPVKVDDDLLQSFAIYTKMEKQRLGHGDEAEAAASGSSTRNAELKDAVVPAAGPKEDEDEDEERPSESEAKSVDVDDLLDDYYLGDDVKSISSLSSWSTDADPERNLNPDKVRAKEAIMDTSLVASTKDLDKHSLAKGAEKEKDNDVFLLDGSGVVSAEKDTNMESLEEKTSALEAMDVDSDEPKLRNGEEAVRAKRVVNWTRLLDENDDEGRENGNPEPWVPEQQQSPSTAKMQPTMLSERAQWDVSARIGSSKVAMSDPQVRRLHRRLQLRRVKKMLGVTLFDIDSIVKDCMRRKQHAWDFFNADQTIAAVAALGSGTGAQEMVVDDTADMSGIKAVCAQNGAQPTGSLEVQAHRALESAGNVSVPLNLQDSAEDGGELVSVTPYVHSFASRLLGRAALRDSLTSPEARVSPYHGRLLRPYIWRDWSKNGTGGQASGVLEPALLWLHRDIRSRRHKLFDKLGSCEGSVGGMDEMVSGSESIDYVYFQEEHVQQVNALLARTFWSGIDVRDTLMYPEFTVVALYKRLVIGCAFLTPDAYLTYIAVSAGWEGAGIAKFMLYHLTQTVPTKDVTLHVSANNLAMLLYQQFGFKPEKYEVNFYKAYLPESSRLSASAFFMRLRRY